MMNRAIRKPTAEPFGIIGDGAVGLNTPYIDVQDLLNIREKVTEEEIRAYSNEPQRPLLDVTP